MFIQRGALCPAGANANQYSQAQVSRERDDCRPEWASLHLRDVSVRKPVKRGEFYTLDDLYDEIKATL